jgi:hypothetical protein
MYSFGPGLIILPNLIILYLSLGSHCALENALQVPPAGVPLDNLL